MRAKYEYKGKNYTATELSVISGLAADAIRRRINSGWSVEKAINTPLKKPAQKVVKTEIRCKVMFLEPIPGVFESMQPKLNKVYIAKQCETTRKSKNNRDFCIITLENGKKLIVYPDEFINLGAVDNNIA